MNKAELAQYLVNLHTLMAAQTSTSEWLAAEYQANWDVLKEQLKKEQEE